MDTLRDILINWVFVSILFTPSLHGGQVRARKIVVPKYPWEAQQQGISGKITVNMVANVNGVPTQINRIGGSRILFRHVIAALKNWRFNSEVNKNIVIEFRLVNHSAYDKLAGAIEIDNDENLIIFEQRIELPTPDVN